MLLHVAWQGYKGIIASKIYEYIASGTKIIVAPSDNGAIEDIVNSSGCGCVLSDEEDLVKFLETEYTKYKEGIAESNDISKDRIQAFSRKDKWRILSLFLNQKWFKTLYLFLIHLYVKLSGLTLGVLFKKTGNPFGTSQAWLFQIDRISLL